MHHVLKLVVFEPGDVHDLIDGDQVKLHVGEDVQSCLTHRNCVGVQEEGLVACHLEGAKLERHQVVFHIDELVRKLLMRQILVVAGEPYFALVNLVLSKDLSWVLSTVEGLAFGRRLLDRNLRRLVGALT